MPERATPPQRKGGLGRGLAALIPTTEPAQSTGAAQQAPGRTSHALSTPPLPTQVRSTDRGADAASPTGVDHVPPAAADDTAPAAVDGAVFREIDVAAVEPNPQQPRTQFDEESLAELEHSIREFGLLQPIVVREVSGGSYQLVMGERRWRAAQRAGLSRVPAIVRSTGNESMLRDALLENIHRVQLNPLDEAAAYEQLLDEFGVSQTELADRLGRSRPVVTNTIRLLKLPVSVQRRVAAGVLSAGHARALLGVEDPGQQEELAARIVAEGLSVRATEEAVVLLRRDSSGTTDKPPRQKPMEVPGAEELADRLSDAYDTRVKVEMGKRKGRIVVEFGSVEDLERIAQLMNGTDG